jgi:hypothetical protein
MARGKRLGRVAALRGIGSPSAPTESGEPVPESKSPPRSDPNTRVVERAARRAVANASPPRRDLAVDTRIPQDEIDDRLLSLSIPADVMFQLEERARRDHASLRVVLLQALAAAGYRVSQYEQLYRPRRSAVYLDLARAIMISSLLSR